MNVPCAIRHKLILRNYPLLPEIPIYLRYLHHVAALPERQFQGVRTPHRRH